MSDSPKPPLTTTTSIFPAAAVLILAVVMLGVFGLVDVLSSKGVAPTTTLPNFVGGVPSASASQTKLLTAFCSGYSQIPTNVASAFVVPTDTTFRPGASIPNQGAGDYDCVQPYKTTKYGASAVLGYYAAQLESRGWSLFSHGASNGSPQSLFQKGGNDGFYWIIGITITSTSQSSTNWTFRIYQNSESI